MTSVKELYKLFKQCSCVCTDSRKIIPDSFFIALRGDNFNANQFAGQALESGCKYAVVDDEKYAPDKRCILVGDTLKTLQELASFHRAALKIPVIGITGTNGKTTTKELLTAVLLKKYKTASTQGNLNNHIGVPLTLLSIKDEEIAVVEMGASHPGEIAMLCKISQPGFGLITNIGKAHLEGFGNLEGVVNTKKELYDWIRSINGKSFVCRDNSLLMEISEGTGKITYGVNPRSNCRGQIKESDPLLKLIWHNDSQTVDIATNLYGFFNFENVMAAICIGNYFGVEEGKIKEAIENYFPSDNRSQVITTKKNIVIMDAYNANPTSMDASIQNFMQLNSEKKYAVVGDMLELGNDSEKEHEKILDLLNDADFEKVIVVGKVFYFLNRSEKFLAFKNSDDASDYLKNNKPSGYHFLIKGSRGIRLEKILEAL
ncbi:MAG: UDP-N-acetylmuramoyl-tripeptide--D-alanyl-D-alanine ligase [Bacteroidota bacterium]